jgi:hypothetical protein
VVGYDFPIFAAPGWIRQTHAQMPMFAEFAIKINNDGHQ